MWCPLFRSLLFRRNWNWSTTNSFTSRNDFMIYELKFTFYLHLLKVSRNKKGETHKILFSLSISIIFRSLIEVIYSCCYKRIFISVKRKNVNHLWNSDWKKYIKTEVFNIKSGNLAEYISLCSSQSFWYSFSVALAFRKIHY